MDLIVLVIHYSLPFPARFISVVSICFVSVILVVSTVSCSVVSFRWFLVVLFSVVRFGCFSVSDFCTCLSFLLFTQSDCFNSQNLPSYSTTLGY